MLWLLLLLQAAPPGLDAKISYKIEGGLFGASLDAVEAQTGLSFSLVASLLPPGLKVPALTHAGTVTEGLDKLFKPLGLRWEIGELGGVVVLPKDFVYRSYADWLEETFGDACGVQLLEVGEQGQRFGLKVGDILVALDGERMRTMAEFYRACMELPENSEATFTFKRGAETLQVKARLTDRARWVRAFGGIRVDEVPDPWTIYQKAGHRGAAWDGIVRRMFDEARAAPGKKDPMRVLNSALEAARAGCRDPFLMDTVTAQGNHFSAELYQSARLWTDVHHLRAHHGGQAVWVRARMNAKFIAHGPLSVRDEARREVEAAWAALRNVPKPRMRRFFAHALATLHFLEGRYEYCARLMKSIEEHYLRDLDTFEIQLHSQALFRLGRADEAVAQYALYKSRDPDSFDKRYLELTARSGAALKRRGAPPAEELSGPVGLRGWKAMTALDAMNLSAAGKPMNGLRLMKDLEGRYTKGESLPPQPFHDEVELHLFARASVAYPGNSAKCGIVFGAQPKPGNADPDAPDIDAFAGSQYLVTPRNHLWRRHGHGSGALPLPIPGFANDGLDDLLLFKSGDTLTVRSNGAWVATDVDPILANPGMLLYYFDSLIGSVDAGILVSTERCYDNDRIRSLMERAIDHTSKITPEERLKLWDEATLLSPPSTLLKDLRGRVPEKLRKAVPAPAYPADAPPLHILDVPGASRRFTERGATRWIAADPEDADAVWCARPDGVVERMSRARYWTTTHPYIPDVARAVTEVAPPLFLKDSVWFPSNRGLFRYDRRAAVFERVAVAGVFHHARISSISMKGDLLRVEGPGGVWTLDLRKGTWAKP